MTALVGSIITLAGSLFLLFGALGVWRMPDVYNRMQAGTKTSTLGSLLFIIGLILIFPAWSGKLLLVILFLLFTNPVSSHALARAAHFAKIPLSKNSVTDSLSEDQKEKDTTTV